MYYDRFDIALAWYLYCSSWHEGTRDWRYERLSRMLRYFHPGSITLHSLAAESDNAFEIYLSIVERYEGENRAIEERDDLGEN